MDIKRVALTVSDLSSAAAFFADTLRLTAIQTDSCVDVTIGRTVLRLSEGACFGGAHHLAFEVSVASFAAHRTWIENRLPLLANSSGEFELEGPPSWNSRSVYFSGPDQMVLELICRGSRPQPSDPTAELPAFMSISEVGIAVADVTGTVTALHKALSLETYGEPAEHFAPVGDVLGLLILVSSGRPWLPVFDVEAQPQPLKVTLARPGPGTDYPAPREVALNDLATVVIPE